MRTIEDLCIYSSSLEEFNYKIFPKKNELTCILLQAQRRNPTIRESQKRKKIFCGTK